MSLSKLPCGLMVSEENSRFDVLGSNPTILKVLFLSFFPRHLVVCLFLVCIEMNMHAMYRYDNKKVSDLPVNRTLSCFHICTCACMFISIQAKKKRQTTR